MCFNLCVLKFLDTHFKVISKILSLIENRYSVTSRTLLTPLYFLPFPKLIRYLLFLENIVCS